MTLNITLKNPNVKNFKQDQIREKKKTLALTLSTLSRVILANKVLYSKKKFLKGSNNDIHLVFTLQKNFHPFV
jgi:hypothetical protein